MQWLLVGGSRISFDGKKYTVNSGFENHPVVSVSWYGARAYADWLSKKTNKSYSLPTEAQWEYAARGGNRSKGYIYSGSNNLRSVGWSSKNSKFSTHPVKDKKANELGIFDMSGNVMEWCSDYYGSYSGRKQTNPQGPDKGYIRVLRGGSWGYKASSCRVSRRNRYGPGNRHADFGFRLTRIP